MFKIIKKKDFKGKKVGLKTIRVIQGKIVK